MPDEVCTSETSYAVLTTSKSRLFIRTFYTTSPFPPLTVFHRAASSSYTPLLIQADPLS